MPPPSSREIILDAAEELVRELGAANITLDAVAERSGLSKGGLLYHFPSKEKLLSALVERSIHRFEAAREHIMREQEEANELFAEIASHFRKGVHNARATTSILAVMANTPDLLEPFRERFIEKFARLTGTGASRCQIAQILFATYGIGLLEALQISPLNPQQRQCLEQELLRQARQLGDPSHPPVQSGESS